MFYIAAAIGTVLSFAVGCVWYTFLFGKQWQSLMGFSDEKVKKIFTPVRMLAALVCEWFAAACITGLFFNLAVPVWAVFLMIATVVIFSGVKLAIFEGKPVQLILINEGYRFVSVAIVIACVFFLL